MSFLNNSRLRQRSGSVIVLVLVFVILLTFIVTAFLEEATAKIKYYGLFHNRDDLRTDAYSALEITLAVLNQYIEVEGALWGPEQGWNDPLSEAEFIPAHADRINVTFEDESAKLPLSKLGYDDLIILFDVLGYDLPVAQSLADGLIDWTDPDDLRRLNGFDGDDYEDMDPPYRPSNSTILSWDEIRLIEPFNRTFWDEAGRPTPAWAQFKSAVSLFHTGSININQANATVQEYLYEKGVLDLTSFAYFKNGADSEPGTEDDRLYRRENSTAGFLLTETGEAGDSIDLLRIRVEASRGEARFTLEAMVTWSGSIPNAAEEQQPGTRAREVVESQPDSAEEIRQQSRGKTVTEASSVAQLRYPFRFVRLAENRKF